MTDRLKEIEVIQHMKMDQVCPHCGLTPEQGPRRAEGDGAEIVRELRDHSLPPPADNNGRVHKSYWPNKIMRRAADYIEAMGGAVRLSASEAAGYAYPGEDQATLRQAFCDGAVYMETGALPTPPASDNGWRRMDTAPRVEGEPILLLSRTHGVVEARWSPGEWSSEIPGISPREYSGPVWVCGDDAWQIEVEETPIGYLDGEAIGWLPRNALPTPPTEKDKA